MTVQRKPTSKTSDSVKDKKHSLQTGTVPKKGLDFIF